jgi:hypothetical protein
MSNNSKRIVQSNSNDLTKAAHTLKSILGVKASRAAQRHASAMGYTSTNHLIVAVKESPVEQDFEVYINVLRSELLSHHQISLNSVMIESLRDHLTA